MNKVRVDFESWAEDNNICTNMQERGGIRFYECGETDIAWEAYQAAHNAQQAEIDRLMLEHCPNEMSKEQVDEWAKHQKRYDDGVNK